MALIAQEVKQNENPNWNMDLASNTINAADEIMNSALQITKTALVVRYDFWFE